MGLFTSQKFHTLDDLFVEQLQDLYDAEKRLEDNLPKMAEAAHDAQLKECLNEHLAQTQTQASRLESIFDELGKPKERETCEAMKGLLKEGHQMVKAEGDPDVKDAAIIASAQRIEHYEIAGYGTARNFAQRLGHSGIAEKLQATLDEEKQQDARLNELATANINPRAAS